MDNAMIISVPNNRLLCFVSLLIKYCLCIKIPDNGKAIFVFPSKQEPIKGTRLALSCVIKNFTYPASWAKDGNYPLTRCDNDLCTVEFTRDGKYTFHTNKSGIYMRIKNVTHKDIGNYTCSMTEKLNSTYELHYNNIIYPPSECYLTTDGTIFTCTSSCTNALNMLSIWEFNNKRITVLPTANNNSNCSYPSKEYSSSMQIRNGPFSGRGSLSCFCGVNGYPNMIVASESYLANLYTCYNRFCFGISVLCFLFTCVITNALYVPIVKLKLQTKYKIFSWKILLLKFLLMDLIAAIATVAASATICFTACMYNIVIMVALLLSFTISFWGKLLCIWWKLSVDKNEEKHKHQHEVRFIEQGDNHESERKENVCVALPLTQSILRQPTDTTSSFNRNDTKEAGNGEDSGEPEGNKAVERNIDTDVDIHLIDIQSDVTEYPAPFNGETNEEEEKSEMLEKRPSTITNRFDENREKDEQEDHGDNVSDAEQETLPLGENDENEKADSDNDSDAEKEKLLHHSKSDGEELFNGENHLNEETKDNHFPVSSQNDESKDKVKQLPDDDNDGEAEQEYLLNGVKSEETEIQLPRN